MKTMKMGTKLMGGAAVMLALIVVQSLSGLYTIGKFNQQFKITVDTTVYKIRLTDQILAANAEMTSEQRGMILAAFAKDTQELSSHVLKFKQNAETMRSALVETKPLLETAEGKQTTADMSARLVEWLPHYEDLLANCQSGDIAEANRIRKEVVAPIYKKIDSDARRLTELEMGLLARDKAALAQLESTSRWIALGLLTLSLLAGAGLVVVVRNIDRSLRKVSVGLAQGAEQVASAASQIATASQTLAQGSSEQAASIEETSASSQEVETISRQNNDRSHRVAGLMNEAVPIVNAVNTSHQGLAVALADMSASSEKVAKVIKMIDEIAFQTNILALNAAVEAARAGEAGMGFAVVADEVRNLAQRSANAAKDTSDLIEQSLLKSRDGKQKLDAVLTAMEANNKITAAVKVETDAIQVASEEQTRGIGQIGAAIGQMSQVTQTTAAQAEESAAAAQQLNAQAEVMHDIVTQLSQMVGAAHSATPTHAAARSSATPPKGHRPAKTPLRSPLRPAPAGTFAVSDEQFAPF